MHFIAQTARIAQQLPLADIAGDGHHQHRREAEVDLADGRLVAILRQIFFGAFNLFADIVHGLVDVKAGGELQQHEAAALIGVAAHFLDPVDRAHGVFNRAHQHFLGIFR